MRTIKWFGITALIIFLNKTAISQQLKLGDSPYSVEKSAVLDLVSTNQGLLLPRITDTSLINALNPPNGMLIYYAPGDKMLIRKNGIWQGVISQDSLRLSKLTDASIISPQSGQILEYNGSAWVNITPPFLTSIDTSNIVNFYQKVRGLFTGIAPISIGANGYVSISQAGTSSDGYLSSSDWNTFNNKQAADNYLTGLTGDVTATGPGSVTATIAANAVTYGKIQNVSATNKVLGRVSSGSGIIEEINTTGTGDIVRSNSPVLSHPTGIDKIDIGLGNVDNTADSLKPISNATQAALNLKINLSQKGANNGVATLDAGGKVPLSQLAIGAQVYLGTWSAATNTPHVQDGVGTAGDTYRVVEGGTIDLGSGPITLYPSDDIIYNGTIWQRNPATSQVTSVNGQAGTVVLTSDDINEGYTNKYYTDARANLKINVSEKGTNNGVATLDAGGKVPASQLPVGAQVYKGTWDASTNTPTLADGVGTAGWTYRVTVAGTQNLGSGAITFTVGDDVIYNGTIWQRNPSSVGVSSVNSQTGTVVLTTDNINEGNNNKYYADSLARRALSASSPLSYNSTNGNFIISQANTSTNGYLSSIDWNTFNSKQATGNYITALTGDITATGPGSVGATIAANAVTYGKMQSMTANRLLGSGLTGTSVGEITLGTGLSFTGNTLNAATTGGTITSFSSGDLSPLFTTSVSNPTTTPALSFSLISQAQNLLFASPVNSSGTPTFRSLVKADLPSTGVYNDQSNTYTSGSKQIFSASNINADIRLTGNSTDPSTLANGDIWYNSTSHLLKYRANGTTRIFANLDEAQTFTNKTISGTTNTLTNIGNSSLTNSTIGLTLGTSGTDANVSSSPASLGSSITLNIPSASATNRGLLTAADWNTFNNKLNSIDTSSISNFYLKVRSLLSGGVGITYNNNTGVITNSGVTSLNNNTGALTMDTGYISNFYSKVRSLHTVSAPLTYNSSTGLIGITQASSSTNGYLSSADWNTFNSKGAALTFSTGLTNTSGTITSNLSTGIASSNQTVIGSTLASGTLTLSSTSHATKGKILFGSSAYDETNDKLSVGTATSQQRLTIGGAAQEAISRDIRTGALEIMGGTTEATGAYFQITGDQNTNSPYEGSAEFVIRNLARSQFTLWSYDGASTWTQRMQMAGATGNTWLIPNGGSVGVGLSVATTPTALLHLDAGTSSAGTAPLKFTAGTNLATTEAGAIEYNGSHLYFTATNGGTRYQLDQQSVDTSSISNFSTKVRSLLSAGTGISYNNGTGVITNSGVTSLNGNTGSLTMDTSYISNFYLKVRALHSVSAPLTYNSNTGAIAITQANTSTNGYLSSTDWNTFNNKAGSFSTGNLTETGSSILTITGGNGSVVGSGTTIQVKQANTSQNGFLSNTDWNTFNNKADTVSPTFTGIATINSLNLGLQSIATSGGTTTLTNTSPYYTVFTGSSTQSIVLPNATTLQVGQVYVIENNSTGAVTTKTNGGATLWIIATTAEVRVILTANGTAAGTWQVDYLGGNYASGKLFTVNNTVTLNGTDGTTMTLPTTSKTIAANDGSNWTISGQAIGDIPVASSTTAYGKLADVATGSVLVSGGVGVAPSWSSTPSITTPATTDNSTKVATTAFVKSATQPMSSTFTTLTPGATVTFTPAVGTNIYTLTPAQSETINMGTVPAGCVGQLINLVITTSGTTSYTLTFGTNLRDQGNLVTGTTAAKKYVIQYLIESTSSVLEVSRTIAL